MAERTAFSTRSHMTLIAHPPLSQPVFLNKHSRLGRTFDELEYVEAADARSLSREQEAPRRPARRRKKASPHEGLQHLGQVARGDAQFARAERGAYRPPRPMPRGPGRVSRRCFCRRH